MKIHIADSAHCAEVKQAQSKCNYIIYLAGQTESSFSRGKAGKTVDGFHCSVRGDPTINIDRCMRTSYPSLFPLTK